MAANDIKHLKQFLYKETAHYILYTLPQMYTPIPRKTKCLGLLYDCVYGSDQRQCQVTDSMDVLMQKAVNSNSDCEETFCYADITLDAADCLLL